MIIWFVSAAEKLKALNARQKIAHPFLGLQYRIITPLFLASVHRVTSASGIPQFPVS